MTAVTRDLPKRQVLTTRISLGSFDEMIEAMADRGSEHSSSYVCCVNAHMTVEARDPAFAGILRQADFATADGMPVLLALRWFHRVKQERVAGNDIMPALLKRAAERGLSVYFLGATLEVQRRILDRIATELPTLKVAGAYAPPFAPLEAMDFDAEADRINSTGAHIVMVSLGCPKQERWMSLMKGRVNAIMLGMGGAFLLYAGLDTRAPIWMRRLSLEWLYRLWLEPRRLWRRYLVTNSIFVMLFLRAVIARRFRRIGDASAA
ncbi:MAG: WecB/TagA/CpsF family glycosyltransferase [Flavobacteriales bacterium]|nr:WecB/TagA/CpsF family glycosyltransferase [Flavobacteriales bacterium]